MDFMQTRADSGAPRIVLVDSYSVDGRGLSHLAKALLVAFTRMRRPPKTDVICAKVIGLSGLPSARFPDVDVLPLLAQDDWRSVLRVERSVARGGYDLAIFNMFSTSFGTSSLANALGMVVPVLIARLTGTPVAVIYHNSTFTNDYRRLGYVRGWDNLRARVLRLAERVLFGSTKTFVLLKMYRDRINSQLGFDAVGYLDIRELDALGAAYVAGMARNTVLDRSEFRHWSVPMVLLHGSWGPQKDLEFALQTMRNLRSAGIRFHLVLSGSVNSHFPGYLSELDRLREQYPDVIDEYMGRVSDEEICNLFLSTDLALLSYNTPGGVSGVLETAAFFETPVVAVRFPEFEEESRDSKIVTLCDRSRFEETVRMTLRSVPAVRSRIDMVARLDSATVRVESFLQAVGIGEPAGNSPPS